MKKTELSALALVVTTVLSACGGGGGSSPQTAPLTLRVTDSPIDPELIDAVCIRFTRITVHYAGQDEVTLDYNPLPSQVGPTTHCMTSSVWDGQSPVPPVRLSALGGPLTVALAESLQVPVGRVTWIRLHFATGSYVIETIRRTASPGVPELRANGQQRRPRLQAEPDVRGRKRWLGAHGRHRPAEVVARGLDRLCAAPDGSHREHGGAWHDRRPRRRRSHPPRIKVRWHEPRDRLRGVRLQRP